MTDDDSWETGRPSPEPPAIDCAVVIVTYRSADDLDMLLSSVPAAARDVVTEVIVVDNASGDHVGEVVERHPGVRLIRSGGNLGYSGGINAALAHLPPTRWILVLNPDLVLGVGCIELLIKAAEDVGAGAVVPKVVGEDGELALSLRREPSLLRSLGEGLLGDRFPGRPSWAAEMVRDRAYYDQRQQVEWATGAAVLVSADAASVVGEWDSRFFLYSEETDYFRRLRTAGFSAWYVPQVTVRHRGGGSGSSPSLVALLEVNRVRYYRKWHGPVASAAFWLTAVVGAALRVSRPGQRAALAALVRPSRHRSLPGHGSPHLGNSALPVGGALTAPNTMIGRTR